MQEPQSERKSLSRLLFCDSGLSGEGAWLVLVLVVGGACRAWGSLQAGSSSQSLRPRGKQSQPLVLAALQLQSLVPSQPVQQSPITSHGQRARTHVHVQAHSQGLLFFVLHPLGKFWVKSLTV